jgi:cytochrome c oxidase subunit 2
MGRKVKNIIKMLVSNIYYFEIFNYMITTSLCDIAYPWQITFQDPATSTIWGIIQLHDTIISVLIGVGVFVFWLLARAIMRFEASVNPIPEKNFTHSTPLEIAWTVIPTLLLIYIAGPSFALLYSIDAFVKPDFTVKVVGNQWYWAYEVDSFISKKTKKGFSFESYITADKDLKIGGLRLLEVDNQIVLPVNKMVEVLVTSNDVLHSWAVPSLGIKIDACPGRLNQVFVKLLRKGIYYGQCSEICGVNHGFIPIVVRGVTEKQFITWISKNHSKS